MHYYVMAREEFECTVVSVEWILAARRFDQCSIERGTKITKARFRTCVVSAVCGVIITNSPWPNSFVRCSLKFVHCAINVFVIVSASLCASEENMIWTTEI